MPAKLSITAKKKGTERDRDKDKERQREKEREKNKKVQLSFLEETRQLEAAALLPQLQKRERQ